ncbi:unnamed protein product [Lampetra fluviatilis]
MLQLDGSGWDDQPGSSGFTSSRPNSGNAVHALADVTVEIPPGTQMPIPLRYRKWLEAADGAAGGRVIPPADTQALKSIEAPDEQPPTRPVPSMEDAEPAPSSY